MHLDDIEGAVELFRKKEEICRRRGFSRYLADCLNNLVMPLQMLDRQEEADAAASEALDLVERYKLSTRR
jgi:hypothetical protein